MIFSKIVLGVLCCTILQSSAIPQFYIFRRQVPPVVLPGMMQFQQAGFPQLLLPSSTTPFPPLQEGVTQQTLQQSTPSVGLPEIQVTNFQQSAELGFNPFIESGVQQVPQANPQEPIINIQQQSQQLNQVTAQEPLNPFQGANNGEQFRPPSTQQPDIQQTQQLNVGETTQLSGFNPFDESNVLQPPSIDQLQQQNPQQFQLPTNTPQLQETNSPQIQNNVEQFPHTDIDILPDLNFQVQPNPPGGNVQPNIVPNNNTVILVELPLARVKPVTCREQEHWTSRCNNDCHCSSGRFCTEYGFCHFGRVA